MLESPTYINEYLITEKMTLSAWEKKLNEGWDRVGPYFFRKRFDVFEGFNVNLEFVRVTLELMPLRFRLDNTFKFSKSQKINLRKNKDLTRVFQPAKITDEKIALFDTWYFNRFGTENSITQWVSENNRPFPQMECAVYDKDKLVACSYFDETSKSNYSTLAFYSPEEYKRSLGTFTLISEIEYGLQKKKMFHYPGHAHKEQTMYEYKKQFANPEFFNWDELVWMKLIK